MFSFRKSLAALAGLLVIAAAVALLPLAGRGQGDAKNPLKRDARRSFYLTQSQHNGAEALSACAEGYHMASLWEIFDTSNLRYDTELGLTKDDSGFGPPNAALGWIRTGSEASGANSPGVANCQAWTSASGADLGTVVVLTSFWEAPALRTSPWFASVRPCDQPGDRRVWCVQD